MEKKFVGSDATERRLRILICLDSLRAPGWIKRAVDMLLAEEAIDVVAVACAERSSSTSHDSAGRPSGLKRRLWSTYENIDRRLFNWGKPDALARAESIDLPDSCSILRAERQHASAGVFDFRVADPIGEMDIDVCIYLGAGAPAIPFSCAGRAGTCWLQFGQPGSLSDDADFFWGMYADDDVVETRLLQASTQKKAPTIVYRSFGATHPYSLFQCRNPHLWKAADFFARSIRQRKISVQPITDSSENGGDHESTLSGVRRASFLHMMLFWCKVCWRYVRKKIFETAFNDRWRIAYRTVHPDRLGDDPFKEIDPPPGGFSADPFLVSKNGQSYLFYEDVRFAQPKGTIACATLRSDGSTTTPQTVLECDSHLSYPMTFSWQGRDYMIPESSQSRRIELFCAIEFPTKWQSEAVLFADIRAVDTTFFENDEGLWLFTNVAADGASTYDELHIFFANELLGPWLPHPHNPVISDVSRARPAGHLFMVGGDLIRPSQDSSKRYGYALNFNRVDVLSREEYRETLVKRIVPEDFRFGRATHTFNRGVQFEVVDIQKPSLRLLRS